jgi:hypothetical protein
MQRRGALFWSKSPGVDGTPKQRHIAYLGSFDYEQDAHYRAWWWHRMNAKLNALGNRIPADDRPRIEPALVEKVPKVTADEVTAYDLQHQHKRRVELELGECRACYLDWPEGQAGVPPRPEFPEVPETERWANVLAAVRLRQK